MEILNDKTITPHRLHAMVRVVPRLRQPQREDLLDLTQPKMLIGKNSKGQFDQSTSSNVLSAAVNLNLLTVVGDNQIYELHSSIERKHIDNIDYFRNLMRERMSDEQSEHNPLMRRFTAWYAVQSERVFESKSNMELAKKFADEMSDRDILDKGKFFNDTKYGGWLQWANFLGWGWKMNLGYKRIIPNCAPILTASLDTLLPDNDETIMREFMGRIARTYTELDGGREFERCWVDSRPNETRGNQISMMLSSGLHTLETEGKIKLITHNDSPDVWRLFQTEGKTSEVTHIQRITKLKGGKR